MSEVMSHPLTSHRGQSPLYINRKKCVLDIDFQDFFASKKKNQQNTQFSVISFMQYDVAFQLFFSDLHSVLYHRSCQPVLIHQIYQ